MTEVKDPQLKTERWMHSPVFRLKDHGNRGCVILNLEGLFGFRPAKIAVTKVYGQNNRFVLSAEKTPEKLAEEQATLDSLMLPKKNAKSKK